jgi:hypothetical protein
LGGTRGCGRDKPDQGRAGLTAPGSASFAAELASYSRRQLVFVFKPRARSRQSERRRSTGLDCAACLAGRRHAMNRGRQDSGEVDEKIVRRQANQSGEIPDTLVAENMPQI